VNAVVWIGLAMAAGGIALLGWVIARARRMPRDDAAAQQAALRGLIALNFGAVALAFLGLGVVVVGFLIVPPA
jgi:hypothetical protein